MKVENIARMKIKNSRELLMMEKAQSIKRDQQIRKQQCQCQRRESIDTRSISVIKNKIKPQLKGILNDYLSNLQLSNNMLQKYTLKNHQLKNTNIVFSSKPHNSTRNLKSKLKFNPDTRNQF